MPLGFYYSQAQDWHEKGGAGNDWDFGPDQGPDGKELKDYDEYLRGKAEPQVRELLTGYGPVALIWFDTPRMMTPERGAALHRHRAHAAAEDAHRRPAGRGRRLRHDRRQRHPRHGVQPTPGRCRPPSTTPGATARTTTTGSRRATSPSSSSTSSARAATTCSTSGPMADGVIPPAEPGRAARRSGRWLKVNGEAVYGAGPTPVGRRVRASRARRARRTCAASRSFLPRNEWRVTTKPGKLYFTFFQEPRVPFELPPMKNAVKRAYRLADGEPVEMKVEDGRPHARRSRGPILDPDGHRRRGRDRGRRGGAVRRGAEAAVNRRGFLGGAGASAAGMALGGRARRRRDGTGTGTGAGAGATASTGSSVASRLAEPVLTNLARGTLKARMPVEEAAGAGRALRHLSRGLRASAGRHRALAGAARGRRPPEGRLRARYADLARQAPGRGRRSRPRRTP